MRNTRAGRPRFALTPGRDPHSLTSQHVMTMAHSSATAAVALWSVGSNQLRR